CNDKSYFFNSTYSCSISSSVTGKLPVFRKLSTKVLAYIVILGDPINTAAALIQGYCVNAAVVVIPPILVPAIPICPFNKRPDSSRYVLISPNSWTFCSTIFQKETCLLIAETSACLSP